MAVEDNDEGILFEAAGWMARLSDVAASEQDKEALKHWLAADARHLAAMKTVEAQWQLTGHLVGDPAMIAQPRRPTRPATSRRRIPFWPLVAATPLAAALAVALLLHPFRNTASYDAPLGASIEITLADGSVVRMNTGSSMIVTYDLFERHVVLRHGEADFSVSHNAWRPFIVDAENTRIRVTGTHFLVREETRQVQTFLVSGTVELRDPVTEKQLARLQPGNLATVAADGSIHIDQSDGIRESAWLSGKLVFSQTRLSDALAEFHRYTPETVTLASDELRAVAISGVYKATDLIGFLDTLSRLQPLRVTRVSENKFAIESIKKQDTKSLRKD